MPTPREEIHRWPDWMPVPLQDGYGVAPEDRRVRSDFDIGSMFRIEYDTDETVISCRLEVNETEANFFEAFERDLLVQGSRWFLMPLWVGGQMMDHLVRFKTRPELSGKELSGEATYTFKLEISKREGLMGEGLIWLLILFGPEDLYHWFNRLHHILHDEMPGVSNIPEDLLP
jgi:hypothetical protein